MNEKQEVLFDNFNCIEDKKLILNKDKIINYLKELLLLDNLKDIKSKIFLIQTNIKDSKSDKIGFLNIDNNKETIEINHKYLSQELNQILETQTLGRTKYYIQRLIKALSEVKTSKINDINLNRWKEYEDIITDSLWVLDKRNNSGAHLGWYWGNFIPQIPNQFFRRYTKRGDWVLDTFLGSGTTLIECKRLGINGIGIELQEKVAKAAEELIKKEPNRYNIKTNVVLGDSIEIDFKEILKEIGIKSVQFLIMHPPYWDIIQFSEDKRDLSNAKSIDEFLNMFGKIIDNTYSILDKGRYFALVIGDKYSNGEWIPLGFYCMQEVLKRGYQLKSTIVKNFEETKGKRNQKELWRYRALVGGFYIFKHEYIFLFKKKGE